MTLNSPTINYHNLLVEVSRNGEEVHNQRTNNHCYQVLNKSYTYTSLPLVFTKKVAMRSAVAEMLGYLKGYDSAADFRALGTKTWDANANAPVWQSNPNCKGVDDMGRVYGVPGRSWLIPDKAGLPFKDPYTGKINKVDQLAKIISHLSDWYDDRGEILSFWNPGEIHLGCLRPCMYSHHFSLSNFSDERPTLHLTSDQRSADVPLGLPFNMVQTWFLLSFMAWITGCNVGNVTHRIVNAHIYANQMDGVNEQISRIGEGMILEEKAGKLDFKFTSRFGSTEDVSNLSLKDKLALIDEFTCDDIVFPVVETCRPISFPFSV